MANLTPEMKDISFNNSFGFRPMPGTCERCVFGRGAHSPSCEPGWKAELLAVVHKHDLPFEVPESLQFDTVR